MADVRIVEVDITGRSDGEIPAWDTASGKHLYTAAAASAVNEFVGTMPPWFANAGLGPGANVASLTKFRVSTAKAITNVYYNLSVSSGNLDIGIYDEALSLVASTGTFASPGTGQRTRALSASLSGNTIYYAAFAGDNGTYRLTGFAAGSGLSPAGGGWNLHGTKASSFVLPSTISSPTWDLTTAYCPSLIFF